MVANLTIRVMRESDVETGFNLSANAGWNQLRADWFRIREYQPDGCFVGLVDGQVVATISTTCYGNKLAWIGMMLVHPSFRRRGIANALMVYAIQWLDRQGIECIKLDATPAGATVYSQLDFKPEWEFHRYTNNSAESLNNLQTGLVQFTPSLLDQAAFGVDRSQWLQSLARDSIVEQQDNGFGMLRAGRMASYLGPVVATSATTARQVLTKLLSAVNGPIFWDVPSPNLAAGRLAEEFGFHPARNLTRMWRGMSCETCELDLQFALASPATG